MINIKSRPTCWRSLTGCRDGVTLVEFALLAPVMMLMFVGLLDVGYTAYVTAGLQGAVQKAARDAALQTNNTATAAALLDARVTEQVQALGRNIPQPVFSRRYFRNYTQAAAQQHEPFNDTNGNHRCDANENYTDTNGNLTWDADGGDAGGGGAQDRAIYTVSITYDRIVPLPNFIDVPDTMTLRATTVLINQPYADQATYAAATPMGRTCP